MALPPRTHAWRDPTPPGILYRVERTDLTPVNAMAGDSAALLAVRLGAHAIGELVEVRLSCRSEAEATTWTGRMRDRGATRLDIHPADDPAAARAAVKALLEGVSR